MSINEHSNLSINDSDEPHDEQKNKKMPSLSPLFTSKNRLDQRFIVLDSFKSKRNESKEEAFD